MITRKDVIVPESSARYVSGLKEDDLQEALLRNTKQFRKLLKTIPKKKINYAYAEGKWTLKEMLQHIVDAERVFSYRALSFARKDPAPLPGFDENTWAITAKAPKRKWNDIIDEFNALRNANLLFFASLDEDQLLTTGTANNNLGNVAGLGFLCAGHVHHHMNIIRERYLTEYVVKELKPVKVKEIRLKEKEKAKHRKKVK